MTEDVEDGGEMTNHRTEEPIFAAWTAATSPIPPGGEMTTMFLPLPLPLAIWSVVLVREEIVCDGRNAFVDAHASSIIAVAKRRFAML